MKRVLLSFTGAAALLATGADAAPSLGGFPIREPGQASAGAPHSSSGTRDEVVVSQSPSSKVRTIAQAMRLVKPGGTIIVQGGVYEENLDIAKAVSIRGVPDAYGRNVVFKASAGKSCATVHPGTPMAPVSMSQVIFKFETERFGPPCIDVEGGSFSLRDSFIIPADADIPIRAAYGKMMPELYGAIASPQHDPQNTPEFLQRLKGYASHHAQAAGADHPGWSLMTGGSYVEEGVHLRTDQGGPLNGPIAGIKVAAGDVRIEGNVIIGARTGVSFASLDEAQMRGSVSNNVILGNLVGVAVDGIAADLLVTRNTIRYNPEAGVKADVYDGIKLIANEFSANGVGIDLSEKVRMATITSNLIVGNISDAIKVSSGFSGAVAANTIAGNRGCTIQFYSAEQKIFNNVETKVTAYKDFQPALAYEQTNYAADNMGDERISKRGLKRRGLKKEEVSTVLAPCSDAL